MKNRNTLQYHHKLHDLVLCDARRLSTLHHILRSAICIEILDERDAQRTTTVLITGEFGYEV